MVYHRSLLQQNLRAILCFSSVDKHQAFGIVWVAKCMLVYLEMKRPNWLPPVFLCTLLSPMTLRSSATKSQAQPQICQRQDTLWRLSFKKSVKLVLIVLKPTLILYLCLNSMHIIQCSLPIPSYRTLSRAQWCWKRWKKGWRSILCDSIRTYRKVLVNS